MCGRRRCAALRRSLSFYAAVFFLVNANVHLLPYRISEA
jgi:hypothetical protein